MTDIITQEVTNRNSEWNRWSHTLHSASYNTQLKTAKGYGAKNDIDTYLHIVDDLQKGEGHSTTDNHLIDLVKHVFDQLNLISNFSSARTNTALIVVVSKTTSSINL